jgi:hypothetical protein
LAGCRLHPTEIVYPNGRVLYLNYGTSAAIDDALSRIVSLIDNNGLTHLADYTRIGRNTFVQQSSPQPQIAWSLITGSGADPYSGIDQFNRVVDNRWYSTATNGDLDRIQHGYDRASNRRWRRNTVAEAVGANLDELYKYDGLYRLAEMQRGQLNSAGTAIVSGTLMFAQAWGLDATGNWQQFWQSSTGASWDLQQSRIANVANEITSIVGGAWAQPAYDTAGNMVQMPQTSSPTTANAMIFDAWNRMISISGGGLPIQQNAYDGEGRRVSKLASTTLRHYYYRFGDCRSFEERVGSGVSPDRQFVLGVRLADDLVLRDRGTERFYALQDPQGDITSICAATGAISERYLYTPYGTPTFLTASFSVLSASAYAWETLFGGHRWDPESDLLGACGTYLTTLLGSWLYRAQDQLGLDSPNLYAYGRERSPRASEPRSRRPQSEPMASKARQAKGPKVTCELQLCCGKLLWFGDPINCIFNKGLRNRSPCHCFIHFTKTIVVPQEPRNPIVTDVHGVPKDEPASGCPVCPIPGRQERFVLKCDTKLPDFVGYGPEKCIALTPKAANCDGIEKCLNDQMKACNDKTRCYPACDFPNSNTAAYEFTSSCATDQIATPPVRGCNAGAPGWGPEPGPAIAIEPLKICL